MLRKLQSGLKCGTAESDGWKGNEIAVLCSTGFNIGEPWRVSDGLDQRKWHDLILIYRSITLAAMWKSVGT